MKYLIIVLLLSGCNTWGNFIHEQHQQELKEEIACEESGGKYRHYKLLTQIFEDRCVYD